MKPPTPSEGGPPPVYLHGAAARCALGGTGPGLRAALATDPPPAGLVQLGDFPAAPRVRLRDRGSPWPIDAPAWRQAVEDDVRAVLDETGADRDGLLLVASTSFEIGALELGGAWAADGLAWVEALAAAAGWRGPVHSVNTACTSSLHALALAREALVRDADARPVTVLGLEARNRYSLAGFASLGLMGEDAGLVAGEAVAALVVSRRPARWCLEAVATRVSGADPGAADEDALGQVVDQALADAGRAATAVDAVLMHAAGQPRNDDTERRVLDARLPAGLPCWRLKPHLGHTQGASTALELALMTTGCVAGEIAAPTATVQVLLAVAVGFGGGHGALVLSRNDALASPTLAPPALGRSNAGGAHPPSGADGPRPAMPRRHSPSELFVPDLGEDRWPGPAWTRAGACLGPPPASWRADLAQRLGARPRRLGVWAELALWGARRALDAAGLERLPPQALLRLCSYSGPVSALREGLDALRADGSPLPYTFLQSQIAVSLAHLVAALGGSGQAVALAARDPAAWLPDPAQAPDGVLVGWVDEVPTPVSCWTWLRPAGSRVGLSSPA